MPYIGVKTSVDITAEKEAVLKAKMGKAVETLPGKSERWLMCEFTDSCRLWLSGSDAPAAFVEVKLYGKADSAVYERMSGIICIILADELEIPSDRVYITYSEFTDWGWNGSNF